MPKITIDVPENDCEECYCLTWGNPLTRQKRVECVMFGKYLVQGDNNKYSRCQKCLDEEVNNGI